jgi:hypothetical protein
MPRHSRRHRRRWLHGSSDPSAITVLSAAALDSDPLGLLLARLCHRGKARSGAAVLDGRYVSGAPLTGDQIALMQNDNVASFQFPGLRELGAEPKPVDAVLDEVVRRAAA